MNNTEKLYIEKLKELICVQTEMIEKHEGRPINKEWHILSNELQAIESDLASLEKQIEKEKEINSDEICNFCGRKMSPRERHVYDYLCMNPKCDNYIKVK